MLARPALLLASVSLIMTGALAETPSTDIPPIWDENGYPTVAGPDRITDWRPESFFRMFYKGDLDSSHNNTGIEDFGYYGGKPAEQTGHATAAQSLGTPPYPVQDTAASTPTTALATGSIRDAIYLDDGQVLVKRVMAESSKPRLELLAGDSRLTSITPPAAWSQSALDALRGRLVSAGDRFILNPDAFVIQMVGRGDNQPGNPIRIPSRFSNGPAAARHGVVALGADRLLLWAARDNPVPYAEAIVYDLNLKRVLRTLELGDGRSRWARVMSLTGVPGDTSRVRFRLDGVGGSILNRQTALYDLLVDSGQRQLIGTLAAQRKKFSLHRLMADDQNGLIAIYRNNRGHLLIHTDSSRDLLLPTDTETRGIALSPDGHHLLLKDTGNRLWWINLQPLVAIIHLASATGLPAESHAIRLANNGDFETIGPAGGIRHSSLIPGADARLRPFVEAHLLLRQGLTNEGLRQLQTAVIGDPAFAARGSLLPELPWLGVNSAADRILARDNRAGLAALGSVLINIIASSGGAHGSAGDQALTLYATLARMAGHKVLSDRALARLPDSDWNRVLRWALGSQAAKPPGFAIDQAIAAGMSRWIERYPAAFEQALGENYPQLAYVLPGIKRPSVTTHHLANSDFPDLDGRLIRASGGPDHRLSSSPIRLLPSR